MGVRTGSMRKVERRTSGAEAEKRVGIVLCSKVMGAILKGQVYVWRERRDGMIERGWWFRGVSMSLLV